MVKRTVTRTQIRHFLVILAGIGMGQISIISGSDMAVSFSSNHLDSNQAISISSFHTLPAFTYIEEVFVQLDKEILLTKNSREHLQEPHEPPLWFITTSYTLNASHSYARLREAN